MVCTVDGRICFNSTGNSGMARGGSGDILTGLLAGLLARGYDAGSAALLGVCLHGMAGDMAARDIPPEAMNSGDILDSLAGAWGRILQ
jgi:NAD(P)H-hydrate epimerase